MLKEAKFAKFIANYVLFDTWFCSPNSLLKIKGIGYDVIAMVKKTENIHFRYKRVIRSALSIFHASKKRRGSSKYLLPIEAEAINDNKTNPVKLVLEQHRNLDGRSVLIAYTTEKMMSLLSDEI